MLAPPDHAVISVPENSWLLRTKALCENAVKRCVELAFLSRWKPANNATFVDSRHQMKGAENPPANLMMRVHGSSVEEIDVGSQRDRVV